MIGPVSAGVAAACVMKRKEEERGCCHWEDCVFHHCECVPVGKVHRTMGAQIFHCAFCMTLISFWHLHSILLPYIRAASIPIRNYQCKGGRVGGNYVLHPIPNGSISPSIHLGAALRYFAGGSPYDIVCVFGISYSEVMSSVWIAVEAINNCPQFKIAYPDSLEKQKRLQLGSRQLVCPVSSTVQGQLMEF